MESQLNPITVAALLARMITLQYPEYNFAGDVKVTEPERQLAKKMFETMVNLVADANDVQTETLIIKPEKKLWVAKTNVNVDVKKSVSSDTIKRDIKAPCAESRPTKSSDKEQEKMKDRTIKREVEELHISKLNFQENFHPKKDPGPREHSSDTVVPITHSSVLKRKCTQTTKTNKDVDIICLDDSDEETDKNCQIESQSIKQVNQSLTTKSNVAHFMSTSETPSRRPSINTKEESRLHEEALKADAVEHALNLENYTLAEFTRVRNENRKVLGADLRRWATIRACAYNDFEYKVGEQWVKYFVKKYNIIYNKSINSLVFGGDDTLPPLPQLATKKRKVAR